MKSILNSLRLKLMVIASLVGALSLSAADLASTNSTDTPSQNQNANASANSTASDAQMAQKLDKIATGGDNTRQKLDEQLKHAGDFYAALQSKTETSIPDRVVAQAKGVLIFSYWLGTTGVDATGSCAIGMKKTKIGDFSGPVFYSLTGSGSGYPASGERTYVIAFLISDNAVRALTDDNFSWNGTVTVTAGSHAAKVSAGEQPADILIYQKSENANVQAIIGTTNISLDAESTKSFYEKSDITINDIFTDKVLAPGLSNIAIISALNHQAKGMAPMIPPDPYSGATVPVVVPGNVINGDQQHPADTTGPTKP